MDHTGSWSPGDPDTCIQVSVFSWAVSLGTPFCSQLKSPCSDLVLFYLWLCIAGGFIYK